MLCSSQSGPTMQFDRSSPSCEAGPSSRGYAASRDPSPQDALPTRPRHHSRSFSNDPRFAPSPSSWHSHSGPAFSPTADALPKRSPNSSRKNSVSSISSLPNGRVESVSSGSEDRTSPPASSSSATTPSTSPTDTKAPAAELAPSSSPSPSASTSPGQSPSRGARVEPGTGAVEGGGSESEGTRTTLVRLRNAQAKRRPKMMRLTPAFSSLPAAPLTSALKTSGFQVSVTDASTPKATPIAFPTKDAGAPAPEVTAMAAPVHPHSRKALAAKQPPPDSPGAGLQIDLKCIPSPSLADATGTVSTSRLPELATLRDRHGRPIKPSLKSPSASAFLPHRSESTPEIPMGLRTKSVPTTPTVAKAVKFDAKLEHVKIFKFKQRPAAVSRDASPEQTETETEEEKEIFPFFPYTRRGVSSAGSLSPSKAGAGGVGAASSEEFQLVLRLPNFPSSTRLSVDREVFLERIFLADDLRSVKGTVQVRNISFEKWVAVRFTLDNWTTVNEVSAEHSESIKGGTADRFTFSIKLNELLVWPRGSAPALDETKTMLMCLRYTTGGVEFWDNNENQNYQLDFRRRQAPPTPTCTPATGDSQPSRAAVATSSAGTAAKARVLEMGRRGVSRAGFAMEDLRRELDRLRASDDEEREDAGFPPVLLRTPVAVSAAAAGARNSPPVSPGGNRSNSPSMWSARYDFGESLRNPSKGTRTTRVDRAAALDYFSSRPANLARASEMGFSLSSPTKTTTALPSFESQRETPQPKSSSLSPARPRASTTTNDANFLFSVSSPGGRISESSTPSLRDSPDFRHRFGMISPGLGEAVEHQPIPSPNTPSPMVFARALEAAEVTSPLGHERFHSYPPSRSPGSGSGTQSPAGHGVTPLRTHFSASQSPEDDATIRSPSPTVAGGEYDGARSMTGLDGLDFTPESSNASPTSPMGPFQRFSSSESNSVTSTSSLDTASTLVTPEDDASVSRMVPMFDPAASPRSLSPVSTGSSTPEASMIGDANDGTSGRFRPASMTDYDELVSRYCWNSDLVPSGGSMVNTGPHRSTEFEQSMRPRHRSPLPSGSTTPTLGF